MTLKEIADQLESCGYVCEAGKLEMNEAFIALRKYALQEQPNEAVDREADVEEHEEMTIEAAIKHCEEVGRRSPCTPCEREHMRLAAWLTELVSLREDNSALRSAICVFCKENSRLEGMISGCAQCRYKPKGADS